MKRGPFFNNYQASFSLSLAWPFLGVVNTWDSMKSSSLIVKSFQDNPLHLVKLFITHCLFDPSSSFLKPFFVFLTSRSIWIWIGSEKYLRYNILIKLMIEFPCNRRGTIKKPLLKSSWFHVRKSIFSKDKRILKKGQKKSRLKYHLCKQHKMTSFW